MATIKDKAQQTIGEYLETKPEQKKKLEKLREKLLKQEAKKK